MKTILGILCLLSLSVLSGAQINNEREIVDWDSLEKAWINFERFPSEKMLEHVYNILPDKQFVNQTRGYVKISGKVMNLIWKDNLYLLKKEIYSSNRNAVKVALRLLILSDGVYTQSLTSILGNLIRINPQLLIEELDSHKQIISDKILSSILMNFGPYYVDILERYILEIRRRMDSIKKVNGNNKLVEKCLTIYYEREQLFSELLKESNKKIPTARQ